MSFAPQRRALFRHPNLQKWREHVVFCTFWLGNVLRATSELPKVVRTCVLCTFWLGNVLRATTACTFSTSELPKVVRQWCVLYILTWKCASCHNGVHFFDIATSKSGPELRCFLHFDLQMCFAPQRRALFWHLNFQKWSDTGVFCAFWLGNLLRATTACNFSSLIWPAGSAPAALASLLFDPPEPQIIGKTQCFATFIPFRASPSSFLLIFLFSLPLPCSAFHLSILSEVWLLNFLRSLLSWFLAKKHTIMVYDQRSVPAYPPAIKLGSPNPWSIWKSPTNEGNGTQCHVWLPGIAIHQWQLGFVIIRNDSTLW